MKSIVVICVAYRKKGSPVVFLNSWDCVVKDIPEFLEKKDKILEELMKDGDRIVENQVFHILDEIRIAGMLKNKP